MIVTLLGLTLSLWAYLIAFPQPHQRRLDVYGALFALHLVATVVYWLYSFEAAVDAYTYYRDPYRFFLLNPLESGTVFVVHLDQYIRLILGGSFLDHFFLFQAFGMIGLALLMRTFNEIAESLDMTVPFYVYATLFLPSLHFWSVAIGKDSLLIMAVSLSLWAASRLERRYMWMLAAVILMGLIRPHVAVFAVGGIVCMIFLSNRVGILGKLMLIPITVSALVYAALRAQQLFGVEDLASFIEGQQGLGEEFGSGAGIQDLPYPAKLFTLLFRPLFIDASGMLGYIVSVENVVLLGLFGYIVVNWRILWGLVRRVSCVTYASAFAAVLIIMLSLVNYNVGLGQRQKMMAIPAVLLIFAAIYMYKRYLASAAYMASEPVLEVEQPPRETAARA